MSEGTWTKIGALGTLVGAILAGLSLYGTNPDVQIGKSDREEPQLTSRFINVSGNYRGELFNKTYGIPGELSVIIRAEPTGKVVGTVNIRGILTGSGPFEGYTDGKDIDFTSFDPNTGVYITWSGRLQGRDIRGDYKVSLPAQVKQMYPYLRDEDGTWDVSKR